MPWLAIFGEKYITFLPNDFTTRVYPFCPADAEKEKNIIRIC